MRYSTATMLVLAGASNALPQYNVPSPVADCDTESALPALSSVPAVPMPTATGTDSEFPAIPSGGFSLPSGLPSLGGDRPKWPRPSGFPSLPLPWDRPERPTRPTGFPSLPIFGGDRPRPSLPSGFPSLGGERPSLGDLFPNGERPSLPSGFPSLGGDRPSLGDLIPDRERPSLPSGFPSLPSGFPSLGGDRPSLGDLLGGDRERPSFPSGGERPSLGDLFPGRGDSDEDSAPLAPELPEAIPEKAADEEEAAAPAPAPSTCKPPRGGLGSEDGITGGQCCTDMTIIFARGTMEIGNVGTVSGPPMFRAIREKLGADRVTVQGLDYPASAAGNAMMGRQGGDDMAKLVDQALAKCPDTKIILSGYSQGAMVVHAADPNPSKVAGAVLFGDPLKRLSVGDLPKDKYKQFCGTVDMVCGGGGDGDAKGGHIGYGSSADAAADFAIQAAGLA